MERKSLLKITLYSIALLALMLVAATVLFKSPSDPVDAGVRKTITAAIDGFEGKNVRAVADQFLFPLPIGWSDQPMDANQFRDRLDGAFSALTYIDIRVESISIERSADDKQARATIDFQWTVSGRMYPNARSKSEDYNPQQKGEKAILTLKDSGEGWKIISIEELSRH